MSEMTSLNDATFDSWIAAHKGLILVHKKLCPHCKVMHTVIVKALAAGMNAEVATLDVEENPTTAAKYEAERVPALLAVCDGAIVARKNGIMNPTELRNFYDSTQQ